jgi:hypothetical protein
MMAGLHGRARRQAQNENVFQLTLRGGGTWENIFHFLLDPSPGHAERPS